MLRSWTQRLAIMSQSEKEGIAELLVKSAEDARLREDLTIDGELPPQSDIASGPILAPRGNWADIDTLLAELAEDADQSSSSGQDSFRDNFDIIEYLQSQRLIEGGSNTFGFDQGMTSPTENGLWPFLTESDASPSHRMAAQLHALRNDFRHSQYNSLRDPPTPTQIRLDAIESQLYESLVSRDCNLQKLQGANEATLNAVAADVQASIRSCVDEDEAEQKADPSLVAPQAQQSTAASSEATLSDRSPESLGIVRDDKPAAGSVEVDRHQPDREATPTSANADSLVRTPPAVPGISPAVSLEALTAGNQSLHKSYFRAATPLSSSIFDDCAQLCSLLKTPVLWTGSGAPYGGAKGEAEALAASLVTAGQADAVATEDSDVLLAEVPLIRNLTGTKKALEIIDSKAARRCLFPPRVAHVSEASSHRIGNGSADDGQLPIPVEEGDNEAGQQARQAALDRADKLSRYTMIEFALLCGTDYNRTIPGLASRGALRLLRQHGTIRGILRSVGIGVPITASAQNAESGKAKGAAEKYRPPAGMSWREYGGELSRARSIFKNPPDSIRALSLAGLKAHEGRKDGAATSQVEDEDVGRIPGPPGVPLLDVLQQRRLQHDDTLRGGSVGGHDPGEPRRDRIFAIPDYDRGAVSALLRSRGLGSRKTDVDNSKGSALGEHLELALGSHGNRSGSQAGGQAEGNYGDGSFGKAFGGEVASRRFVWDS